MESKCTISILNIKTLQNASQSIVKVFIQTIDPNKYRYFETINIYFLIGRYSERMCIARILINIKLFIPVPAMSIAEPGCSCEQNSTDRPDRTTSESKVKAGGLENFWRQFGPPSRYPWQHCPPQKTRMLVQKPDVGKNVSLSFLMSVLYGRLVRSYKHNTTTISTGV